MMLVAYLRVYLQVGRGDVHVTPDSKVSSALPVLCLADVKRSQQAPWLLTRQHRPLHPLKHLECASKMIQTAVLARCPHLHDIPAYVQLHPPTCLL